jgi:hypothetical protein
MHMQRVGLGGREKRDARCKERERERERESF